MPKVNDFVTIDGLTASDVHRINGRIDFFIFNPRRFIK